MEVLQLWKKETVYEQCVFQALPTRINILGINVDDIMILRGNRFNTVTLNLSRLV